MGCHSQKVIDILLTKEECNLESLQALVDRIAAENDDGRDLYLNLIQPPIEFEDVVKYYAEHRSEWTEVSDDT